MKRAPVIQDIPHTQSTEDTSSLAQPPMVDLLIARVGATRGNAISLPVCGREVKFTLEVLGETLLRALHAYGQAMSAIRNYFTEDALDDLIPSFLLTGQQTPAFGPPGF